jgi:hypothetical protein
LVLSHEDLDFTYCNLFFRSWNTLRVYAGWCIIIIWVLLIAIYFLGLEIHWGSMLGDALLLWRRLFLAMVSSFSNFLWNAIWTLGFALLCLLYGICCIIHLPNHDEKLVIIKFCLLLDRNLLWNKWCVLRTCSWFVFPLFYWYFCLDLMWYSNWILDVS